MLWSARVALTVATALVVAACARAPRLELVTAGGDGPPTLVLLHGFGSSADRWLPFTKTLDWPLPGRFVFPQAPDKTMPPAGPVGGREWWPLDLRALTPPGPSLPDLSDTRPPGLASAARAVAALLEEISRSSGGPVVLGGFSQGAMVASEVAYRTAVPLAALVLLSGTPVDEQTWKAAYATRRGLPTFVAHGRSDPVLPFDGSDRMQHDLAAAGSRITWYPFEGGHEIPADLVVALNRFLAGLRP
jgi:phospholipase/carboxylesterase